MSMKGLFSGAVRAVAGGRNTTFIPRVCFSNRVFKATSSWDRPGRLTSSSLPRPGHFSCSSLPRPGRLTSSSLPRPGHFICYSLPSRNLVQIHGQDTSAFLQGIITNDMNLLGEGRQRSLYAHMLNVKGRTLYDVIIYSLNESSADLNSVVLECDSSLLGAVVQHLTMYKIRRRVTVNTCADLSLWALLPQETRSAPQQLKPEPTSAEKALVLVEDPRTDLMGWRLVARNSENPPDFIAACQQGDPDEYHSHRYKIGLPEGARDLPPGEALPLESNLVFMNGISFSKGCYLGQELTARTHHTGVVRKRLVPVRLSSPVESLQAGAELRSPGDKPVGKYRAGLGRVGLGLVRTAHTDETLRLASSQDRTVTLEVSVPDWWPEDTKSE
ncbi:putative transferase CAF17 homolog, mitochondrial [Electrophorus electricus]|uniref:Iron-sulfur cluster assembly factor IBA57, mitochondrial n=1 Tax=Electrophorus electricus TaxID=8005 RepID=A0AAY5EN96_ELEEL|nr:putative transferase CAF17 homolog, mitochondrial [Electrophorus electricus]